MFASWTTPLNRGGTGEELALAFDRGRDPRLLVLPPLFDEHNKMRRQVVETMRCLDAAGVDCILPDLPGTHESLVPLQEQSLSGWRDAAARAADHFRVTHILAIRGGALMCPDDRPMLCYAPIKGRQVLRAMLRARTIASREAGRDEKSENLLDEGRSEGLVLAGWHLGAPMIRELETAEPPSGARIRAIEQAEVGGSPLWLRAEPGEDPAQATALADIVTEAMRT